MTLISYAQNFEDVMLWRALKHIQKGFYVDVGAFCPNKDSITKFFIHIKIGIGINIEPNFVQHKEFLIHRPRDINLHLAISNQEGYLKFNVVKDPTLTPTGLSTFDNNIAQQHVIKGCLVEIEKIKVTTLAAIFKKYIQPNQEIHFLKIYVEGFEKEVIQNNNWSQYQPWIVLVEAISPIDYQETYYNWEHLLINSGYCFVYADQLNRFYISPKHPELRSAFNYPPNFFNGFSIYNQAEYFILKTIRLIK